jgi:hypothetical protein
MTERTEKGQDLSSNLKNLVVVTGHAIFLARYGVPSDDSDWFLQHFEYGEPPYLIEHIHEGVRLAAADEESLLVFSGGQTRKKAGPRSEAQGYWHLAERFRWWDAEGLEARAATEDFARDSFENLLFSICRFKEWTGRYPEHIHLLSWEFKRGRFDLIREAVRFPKERFNFVGVNQPPDLKSAKAGEAKVVAAIKRDRYGTGPDLGSKRVERNPFRRTAPYKLSCREVVDLLNFSGPGLFAGPLPWD